jgi:outer membrane protein OmpA-like peptidoglycan-associated protein
MPNMTTVTIPSSVQTIGYLAFGTTYLTSITFASPSSLTTIGDYAFQSTRFTSISIPESVTSIGEGAFQENTHLISIAIPSGVTNIRRYTFHNARGLTSISIPNGVTEIGTNAFEGATSLSSVNIPNTLSAIGNQSFKGATSLTSITIPDSVTDIGTEAFFDTRLTSLTIPRSVTTIRNDTFGRIPTLTSITFPSTLISISPGAFFDATTLATVTIPASVTTIGQYAFGNTALANVNFEGNAPASVDADAFYRAPNGAKANIVESATGFEEIGSPWKGLTVTRAAPPPPPPPPPSSSSSESAVQIQPLTKVSSVQIQAGKTAKSSTVKLQLSGVKQGPANENIKIKIFDTKGKLFRTLTVPINETAGSMELTLPLALGEFTIEANTISAAGGATEAMSASSPIVQRSFFSTPSTNRSPKLFGEVFANPISFGASSSSLTSKAKRALLDISTSLKETRSSVAITGFVAQSGASRGFDQTLAKSRALAVAKFLQSQGISNILYVSGFGAINNSRNLDDLRKVELRLIK